MPKISEEHRTARRDQILGAALRCVAREGFHKTTMSAVIKESGLSAGAVYLYFGSKQDLIRTLAGTAIRGIAEAISRLGESEAVPPPEEALAVATQHALDFGRQLGIDLPPVVLQAWAEAARDPQVLEIIRGEAGRIQAAWLAYVRRAIDAGHLDADVVPEDAAASLMGMIPGFMVFRTVFGPDVTPQRYSAGLSALRRPANDLNRPPAD